MSPAEQRFAYGHWRFMMWIGGLGSYSEIDGMVASGMLRPGMSLDDARTRVPLAGTDKESA